MLPDLPWIISVLGFAAATSATPGPNNAMVASSGATFGIVRTIPHMLGISVGFPAMLLAVTLGAGDLLRAAPALQLALKWVGAAYLLWLAWHIATADPAPPGSQAPSRKAGSNRPLTPLQAALFQWVNPKAWILAGTAVTTYTDTAAKALTLSALFAAVSIPSNLLWAFTGVGAARLLRTARGLRAFNIAMAVLLVLSLVPILLEH